MAFVYVLEVALAVVAAVVDVVALVVVLGVVVIIFVLRSFPSHFLFRFWLLSVLLLSSLLLLWLKLFCFAIELLVLFVVV